MSSQLITSKDANNICKCFVKTDVVKLTVCLVKHNCSKGILIILLSQWGPKLKIFNGSLKNIHFCCCSSNYRMSRKGNRECLGSTQLRFGTAGAERRGLVLLKQKAYFFRLHMGTYI